LKLPYRILPNDVTNPTSFAQIPISDDRGAPEQMLAATFISILSPYKSFSTNVIVYEIKPIGDAKLETLPVLSLRPDAQLNDPLPMRPLQFDLRSKNGTLSFEKSFGGSARVFRVGSLSVYRGDELVGRFPIAYYGRGEFPSIENREDLVADSNDRGYH
jgi:hypothetical protein